MDPRGSLEEISPKKVLLVFVLVVFATSITAPVTVYGLNEPMSNASDVVAAG
jgi:hypothetical protein